MKKYFIIFALELLFLAAIYYMFNCFTSDIVYSIPQDDNKSSVVLSNEKNSKMIGYGNSSFSTTPISATINNSILNVKAKITNKTSNKYTINTFSSMSFGGYTYPGSVLFPADTNVINANEEIEVEYEVDLHNIKYTNSIPTELSVELGTYNSNNTYESFDFRYLIAWGE